MPRELRARTPPAQGSQQVGQRLGSLPLSASSLLRPAAATPCASAPLASPSRRPLWPALRVASQPCAPRLSASENAPCLERALSCCSSAPSSSCSSPSWSRGTRPYFSLPSLVNSNPSFSNTFACFHVDAKIPLLTCGLSVWLCYCSFWVFAESPIQIHVDGSEPFW